MKRVPALLAATALCLVALTGCDQMSEDTEQRANEAVCALSDSVVASIRAGGAGARLAAAAVRDVAEEGSEIHTIASKVADNESDSEVRERLAAMIEENCT